LERLTVTSLAEELQAAIKDATALAAHGFYSSKATTFLADHGAALLSLVEASEWRPVSEAPQVAGHIIVRLVTTYRWLPYKPDGRRQMGRPGRWQAATEYGWTNAKLLEGAEFKIAHPEGSKT
jgi:hypothetical protein